MRTPHCVGSPEGFTSNRTSVALKAFLDGTRDGLSSAGGMVASPSEATTCCRGCPSFYTDLHSKSRGCKKLGVKLLGKADMMAMFAPPISPWIRSQATLTCSNSPLPCGCAGWQGYFILRLMFPRYPFSPPSGPATGSFIELCLNRIFLHQAVQHPPPLRDQHTHLNEP